MASIRPRNTRSYSQPKNKRVTSCICLLNPVPTRYVQQPADPCSAEARWKVTLPCCPLFQGDTDAKALAGVIEGKWEKAFNEDLYICGT